MVVAILALVSAAVSAIAGGKRKQGDKQLQDDAILASYRQQAADSFAQKIGFLQSEGESDDKTFRWLLIGGMVILVVMFLINGNSK